MVVKYHQNRHKIHRRCTFIHSSHNWKYFCKPTFVYVHIGQDGIIVLNLILSLTLYGSESPLKVKFYLYISIHNKKNGHTTLKASKIKGFKLFSFFGFSIFLIPFIFLSVLYFFCAIITIFCRTIVVTFLSN